MSLLSRSHKKIKALWLFLIPLVAWGWIYRGHFSRLTNYWNNDDYSYCYLIPFLALYLAYTNWDRIKAHMGGGKWQGYVLLLFGGLLFVAGRVGSLETLVYLSMWAASAGAVLVLLGFGAIRGLAFPLFVLLFAIPAPPFITNQLTFKLRLISSDIAVRGLHLLNFPAFREGNIIDIGVTQLQVVDACSGLRFVIPIVLLSLIIGVLFHTTLWKRTVLLLASLPLAVLTNSLRIIITAYALKAGHTGITEGFWHDFMGWAFFILALALLFGVSLIMKQEQRATEVPVTVLDRREQERGVPLIVHALVVALILVGGHIAETHLVTAQDAPPRQDFTSFPEELAGWQGTRFTLDQSILDSLWADDYVSGSYLAPKGGNQLYLLVPYYATQTTQHTAHAPTACLLGSGWSLSRKTVAPPDPSTGRDFPVTQMVLGKGEGAILSNFWFEQRGRHIVSEYKNKLFLVLDGLTRQRTDGALVRVEMVLLPGQSVDEAQRVLDTFVVPLKAELKRYIPQ